MNKEEFTKEINELGITLTEEQYKKLEKFYNLLIVWNQKINLTRITEKEDVYLKHFYDSLTISKEIDLTKVKTLCDIGTGAGFPGVVLKIVFPNLKITLVDSLLKRVNYLNSIIKELDLKEITTIHSRGEDFKEKFDVVTARAVANIEKLLSFTMHLVSINGVFIAMKANIDNELTEEVQKRINRKYNITRINKFTLPKENSLRSLVVVKNK